MIDHKQLGKESATYEHSENKNKSIFGSVVIRISLGTLTWPGAAQLNSKGASWKASLVIYIFKVKVHNDTL